jgi:hypothetical protein
LGNGIRWRGLGKNLQLTVIKISTNNYGYNVENSILMIPLYGLLLLANDFIKDIFAV